MQPLLTFIRLINNSIFNTIKFIICYFITVFTEDYDFDYLWFDIFKIKLASYGIYKIRFITKCCAALVIE